ncbi:MAG: hypothetical protein UZ06_CHB003000955 [Chlorobi bacterium OLB6]|nr:MAG: hypothetical protein UZ06_CHB003000955 [Chlorobi bacterium OLB6]
MLVPDRRSPLLGTDSLTIVGGSQDRLCALCPTTLLLLIPGISSFSYTSDLLQYRVYGLSVLSRIARLLQDRQLHSLTSAAVGSHLLILVCVKLQLGVWLQLFRGLKRWIRHIFYDTPTLLQQQLLRNS